MMDKNNTFKIVLLVIALQICAVIAAVEMDLYEPVEEACKRCNCTSKNGTIESREHGKFFTLDCTMKNFQRLFTGWPGEAGDNSTDLEFVFMMSQNPLRHLQQFPTTQARIFFTCRHCKIEGIASHAFIDAPNIAFLDLSYNDLTSSSLFPEVFRGPEKDDEYAPIKLEFLDLSHNKINSLEKLLFEHVSQLKSLYLSHNELQKIDEPTGQAIGTLSKLEILDLSYTGISELTSDMLEHLGTLREIFLGGNNFITVPETLSLVGKTLEILCLKENHVEILDEHSFEGLEKLEQLNISSLPNLAEIKANSMKDLTSLEVLHCRGNKKLKNFHMENLRELKNLKDLDVSNNALTTLEFGPILMSHDVEDIEGDNETKKYEDQFKKLRRLKLAGNPWYCGCDMMKALSLFDHKAKYYINNIESDDARCRTPASLSSKLLYQLPEDYFCDTHAKQKDPKIPIYDPPQFLRPKSIMLTVFSVVGVVILGVIIGFAIVCIKRRLKTNENGYRDSPIRYTTVRDSTVSNVANIPYSQ